MSNTAKFCVLLASSSGGLAVYGYLFRFGSPPEDGSPAALGSPVAKKVAPYCLFAAIVFGGIAVTLAAI